jgi:hypothetical protein
LTIWDQKTGVLRENSMDGAEYTPRLQIPHLQRLVP